MSASKTLMAAIAAATIVGTVGYVSAQTTDSTAPAANSQTAPASTTDMSTPPMTGQSTAPAGDLEPKADRN